MRVGVFAGTFDPVTKGHEKVIEKTVNLFDKLIVAICVNKEKHTLFSVEKRLEMLKAVTKKYKNVEVCYHEGMLVDLMKTHNAIYYVRGVRNDTDYKYENYMHSVNSSLYSKIITLFIPCEEDLANVSSTMVRNVLKNNGDLTNLLSNEVIEIIKKSK